MYILPVLFRTPVIASLLSSRVKLKRSLWLIPVKHWKTNTSLICSRRLFVGVQFINLSNCSLFRNPLSTSFHFALYAMKGYCEIQLFSTAKRTARRMCLMCVNVVLVPSRSLSYASNLRSHSTPRVEIITFCPGFARKFSKWTCVAKCRFKVTGLISFQATRRF